MRISDYLAEENVVLNVQKTAVQAVNQDPNQNDASVKGIKPVKKDVVDISSLGKSKNELDSLMKDKQNLLDEKNSFIEKTFKEGGTMKSMKDQLEGYDKKIKELDDQIITKVKDQVTQQIGQQVKLEEMLYNMNAKQPQNLGDLLMNNIMSGLMSTTNTNNQAIDFFQNALATSFNKSQEQLVSSVLKRSEGQARIWESEIKADGPRVSKNKEDRLSDLRTRIDDLDKLLNGEDKKTTPTTPSEKPSETTKATDPVGTISTK